MYDLDVYAAREREVYDTFNLGVLRGFVQGVGIVLLFRHGFFRGAKNTKFIELFFTFCFDQLRITGLG